MNELVDVAREHNLAALVATHNPALPNGWIAP